jgi:hypothetical protein
MIFKTYSSTKSYSERNKNLEDYSLSIAGFMKSKCRYFNFVANCHIKGTLVYLNINVIRVIKILNLRISVNSSLNLIPEDPTPQNQQQSS